MENARTVLDAILRMPSHRFLADPIPAAILPTLSSSRGVTDAHLVRLAASHVLRLATLEETRRTADGRILEPIR